MNNGFIEGFITRALLTLVPVVVRSSLSHRILPGLPGMMKGFQERELKVGNLSTTRVVMDVRDTEKILSQA